MSQAIRCDRCGEYFTMDTVQQGALLTNINLIEYYSADSKKHNKFIEQLVETDLCPACTGAFILFLDNHMVDGEDGNYAEVWTRENPMNRRIYKGYDGDKKEE